MPSRESGLVLQDRFRSASSTITTSNATKPSLATPLEGMEKRFQASGVLSLFLMLARWGSTHKAGFQNLHILGKGRICAVPWP